MTPTSPEPLQRMTKQELIAKQTGMARSSKRGLLIFLIVLFGILLAKIPLAGYMDREKPAEWIQVLYGIALFGFILGFLPVLVWAGRRQQKQFGVRCPNCSKPLIGLAGQIVVATGKCGHCGETILMDESAAENLQLVVIGKEWAQRFTEERSRIAQALGNQALDIQHIGSTAIPGIVAKPILDIAVAIQDFEPGQELVPALAALGYTYRGENGIPRRHYFERGDACHLHAFEIGSSDWERHLGFRDRLLASSDLAIRYSLVKLVAAQKADGSRERYQNLKASFIQEVQNL